MSVEIEILHRRGDFTLDIAFASTARVTALVGPSGCGKTTTLNVIAGLVRADHARVVIDGQTLTDTAENLFVPVRRRGIGYVFQDARLFPHFSVERNLRFGQFFRRNRQAENSGEIIAVLGLEKLLKRRPDSLSGGERQRVAIGRALLSNPRILLMDEPLASIDQERRAEVLSYLERLRDITAVPILYVSHARSELERIAGRTIEMGGGSGLAETLVSSSSVLGSRKARPQAPRPS